MLQRRLKSSSEESIALNKFYDQMLKLKEVVGSMSALYDEYDFLNDMVDIQKLIPMSLDEWDAELTEWLFPTK